MSAGTVPSLPFRHGQSRDARAGAREPRAQRLRPPAWTDRRHTAAERKPWRRPIVRLAGGCFVLRRTLKSFGRRDDRRCWLRRGGFRRRRDVFSTGADRWLSENPTPAAAPPHPERRDLPLHSAARIRAALPPKLLASAPFPREEALAARHRSRRACASAKSSDSASGHQLRAVAARLRMGQRASTERKPVGSGPVQIVNEFLRIESQSMQIPLLRSFAHRRRAPHRLRVAKFFDQNRPRAMQPRTHRAHRTSAPTPPPRSSFLPARRGPPLRGVLRQVAIAWRTRPMDSPRSKFVAELVAAAQ